MNVIFTLAFMLFVALTSGLAGDPASFVELFTLGLLILFLLRVEGAK